MILEHESPNQVFIDIKKFDNIQSFERWFSGISILHPINDTNDSIWWTTNCFKLLCTYSPKCGYNKTSMEIQKDPTKSQKHHIFLISITMTS